jgi:hypothetical protein
MDEEIEEMMGLNSDEDWEKMMRGLGDKELLEYMRRVYEAISQDPEASGLVPPDVLEEMRAGTDKFEKAVRAVKIAEQNEVIAKADLARTADALLAALPEKKRGH